MEARADLTSVGRAWYQAGVLPAAMDDAISEAKPAWLVAAAARTDGGRAVARASRADCWLRSVRHAFRAVTRDFEWRLTQGRCW